LGAREQCTQSNHYNADIITPTPFKVVEEKVCNQLALPRQVANAMAAQDDDPGAIERGKLPASMRPLGDYCQPVGRYMLCAELDGGVAADERVEVFAEVLLSSEEVRCE
jgi:hypothetical protein